MCTPLLKNIQTNMNTILHTTKVIHIEEHDLTIRLILHPFSVRIAVSSKTHMLKARLIWYPTATQFLSNREFRHTYLLKVFGSLLSRQTMDTIHTSCHTYGTLVTNKSASTIQRFWKGYRTRKIFTPQKMRVHYELGLLPLGAIASVFPGGDIYRICQNRFEDSMQ